MEKYIRILLAIMLLAGLFFVARNTAAGAATPTGGGDPASQAQFASPAADNEDCNPHDNRNKDKCKDKNKDKCKKKDNCGTVQPPDDDFEVCQPGKYSVGGVATLDVNKLQDRSRRPDCFEARAEDSDGVTGLPNNAGSVLSDQVVFESVGQGSQIRVCFAAPPGKKVKIYVFEDNRWKAVGTQVRNGIACGNVQSSGSYLLAGN